MPSKNPASKFIELTIKTSSSMHLKVLAKIQNLSLIILNIESLQMKNRKSFNEVFSHRSEKLQNDIVHELALENINISSNIHS